MPKVNSHGRRAVQIQPHTRRSMTILHMPPSILVRIISGMHIHDLLSLGQVCRLFREVTTSTSLWKRASFFRVWPNNEQNVGHFHKAASVNNFEAIIKMAFSRQYFERFPHLSLDEQVREAAMYFTKAECLCENTFSWIFLRPPWSLDLKCSKSRIFFELLNLVAQEERAHWANPHNCKEPDGKLVVVLGRILQLFALHDKADVFIQKGAQHGLPEGQLLQWITSHTFELKSGFSEFGKELAALRELRSYAMHKQKPDVWTQLTLGQSYAKGLLGGHEWSKVTEFTQQLFKSCKPIYVEPVLVGLQPLNSSMRYILVNWLVDLSTTILMSTQILQNTVILLDCCLLARPFRRSEIQLLGVAALVITSRALSESTLAVSDAVRYTDSTYTYENVVMMMGEIVGIMKGCVIQVTCFNYFHMLEPASGLGAHEITLFDFCVEMCLLHSHMTQYSPALMCASCTLLVRIWQNFEEAWPAKLEEFTGFSAEDLTPCVVSVNKCLLESYHFDSQNAPVQAVKQRFEVLNKTDPQHLMYLSDQKLRGKLGAVTSKVRKLRSRLELKQTEELVCLPSYGKCAVKLSTTERSHGDAATSPADQDSSGCVSDSDNSIDDVSSVSLDNSGYEGDLDDVSEPELCESVCSVQREDTHNEPRSECSEIAAETGIGGDAKIEGDMSLSDISALLDLLPTVDTSCCSSSITLNGENCVDGSSVIFIMGCEESPASNSCISFSSIDGSVSTLNSMKTSGGVNISFTSSSISSREEIVSSSSNMISGQDEKTFARSKNIIITPGCSEASQSNPSKIYINVCSPTQSADFRLNYPSSSSSASFPPCTSSSAAVHSNTTVRFSRRETLGNTYVLECSKVSSHNNNSDFGLGNGSGEAELPYPAIEPSAFKGEKYQDQGKFHDLLGTEDKEQDSGVLNETFCGQDLEQAPVVSSPLTPRLVEESREEASTSAFVNRIPHEVQAVLECSEREGNTATPLSNRLLQANGVSSSNVISKPARPNLVIQGSLSLPHHPIEMQGDLSRSSQVLEIAAEEARALPGEFVPLNESVISSMDESLAGSSAGSFTNGDGSFNVLFQVSSIPPNDHLLLIPYLPSSHTIQLVLHSKCALEVTAQNMSDQLPTECMLRRQNDNADGGSPTTEVARSSGDQREEEEQPSVETIKRKRSPSGESRLYSCDQPKRKKCNTSDDDNKTQ